MSKRIRIPGIVDIVRIEEPGAIAAAAHDPALDRDFSAGGGPLVNRIMSTRVRRILHVDGQPLPSLAPRLHPGRAEGQAALRTRLDGQVTDGKLAPDEVARLAAYVRGEMPAAQVGPLVQEVIGRQFTADYTGTSETFSAAKLLNDAPRNLNPLRALAWALTGAIGRARRLLAERVGGDTQAMHATTIAVHTLVRAVEAMRAIRGDPGLAKSLTTRAAVVRALRAPPSVLRRWSRRTSTAYGDLPAGTLAVLELDKARLSDPGGDVVFMVESWSHCPAFRWCETLLAAVWEASASPPSKGAGT
jgi:hypothetical protein